MDTQLRTAPADHLHPERLQLAGLSARLTRLRSTLPLLQRMFAGAQHGVISAVAAVIAYLPAQALGLKQSFWAALTAIAVVQTEFRATQSTARDQFVGATIGGLIGLGALLILGDGLWVFALAVVVAMWICWSINMASASRLAGTTATIISLVPRTESPERMFGARIFEVGWGVGVGLLAVWLLALLPARLIAHTRKLPEPSGPP